MAYFCAKCFEKVFKEKFVEKRFFISRNEAFCEECGEYKKVIVAEKKRVYIRTLKIIFSPIFVVFLILKIVYYGFWELVNIKKR